MASRCYQTRGMKTSNGDARSSRRWKGVVMSFFEVYMEVKAGAGVFHQEALAYREIMGAM
ncbi:hypothetical protein EMPG_15123 [Blastomyces silverae]|uniref:Uncharacterized protein n=1 Tax=Blastomyces silverae TaxID=2060906 RepID=A0A0H1BEA5_9EURO|nr:hypothetical protein EMPG_15123 [Blastomyces silverae]